MKPKFAFPFEPYDIQNKFMTELYFTIENKKLGIFESPTGTGKSLSICCAAFRWLKDANQKVVEDLKIQIHEIKSELSAIKDSDDWLQEEYTKIQKNQSLVILQSRLDKIIQKEEELNELRKRVIQQKLYVEKTKNNFVKSDINIKVQEDNNLQNKESIDDPDFIVSQPEDNNYESDEEEHELNDDKEFMTKIYISSRTHSQLSQFVGEVKKTIFKDNVRLVTLASRQHYCINSDVNKLKNVNLINERCLDLQKSNSKSTSTGVDGKVLKKTKVNSCTVCPYYNQNNITKLKERLLVDIMDMEDLVKCGKVLKACPYYASRKALEQAEVVLVSHAGIVSSGARSGISLKLKDNVLILDEAHGLTAALESAHSAPVSVKQLSSVKTFLGFYIDKYKARLSSKNLLQLNQLKFVVGKLLGLVKFKEMNCHQQAKIYTLEEFVINAEIDHLHLKPLLNFCKSTRLAPKLHGFSMRYNQQELEDNAKVAENKKSSFKEFLNDMAKKSPGELVETKVETKANLQSGVASETSAGSGLYALLDFIEMLCDRSDNGRVFVRPGDSGLLKYLLLNPAERFATVVNECRSVIVAGGTMEPISEFRALLTNNGANSGANSAANAVTVVQCEHVVRADNVLGFSLSKGPSNVHLNFTYDNRSSNQLLSEVGRILSNVCNIVPDGVVCFLPSYSYEQALHEHLCSTQLMETIGKKKKIFREPKSAADVDQVLQKYSSAIKNKTGPETGALLLSVVGGKLSEGLNFSDELGRCVIVIGLPYPNVKSLELQEKINYLNKMSPGAGSMYCENLCMKAVNQCIGRAVRHANDFACILLVDERYSRPHTVSALPSFVKKSLLTNCTFGQTIGNVAKFFARHKQKTNCE